jgi:hypothetical protein
VSSVNIWSSSSETSTRITHDVRKSKSTVEPRCESETMNDAKRNDEARFDHAGFAHGRGDEIMSDDIDIKDVLTTYDNALKRIGHEDNLYGFVLEHGQEYDAMCLPDDIPKMERGECFQNALTIADDDELVYVEGYALRPTLGMLFHHAWCVTPEDDVVDPTWDRPEECQYFGIGFQGQWVHDLGYTGLALESYALHLQAEAEREQS